MAVAQEPVSLLVAGTPVRGMTYRPAEGSGPLGMVLCDPFAEEKKSAQKTLAEMGRALAEAGISALHLDYRGTGDSGGEFGHHNLDDWREDIANGVALKLLSVVDLAIRVDADGDSVGVAKEVM